MRGWKSVVLTTLTTATLAGILTVSPKEPLGGVSVEQLAVYQEQEIQTAAGVDAISTDIIAESLVATTVGSALATEFNQDANRSPWSQSKFRRALISDRF